MRGKVFGIGLSRTGTKSLATALAILGFQSKHYPEFNVGLKGVRILNDELDKFNALTDAPVAMCYKSLEKEFPDAKFILTIRKEEDWLRSVGTFKSFQRESYIKDYLRLLNPRDYLWRRKFFSRRLLYGSHRFNEKKFISAYRRHNNMVLRFFQSRPSKLLVIDLTDGSNQWEKICHFLDLPLPQVPFPHSHKSGISKL